MTAAEYMGTCQNARLTQHPQCQKKQDQRGMFFLLTLSINVIKNMFQKAKLSRNRIIIKTSCNLDLVWCNRLQLHHNNALANYSHMIQEFLAKHGIPQVRQAPYTPDMWRTAISGCSPSWCCWKGSYWEQMIAIQQEAYLEFEDQNPKEKQIFFLSAKGLRLSSKTLHIFIFYHTWVVSPVY